MASIRYRTADVDGFKVFYREAGRADASKLNYYSCMASRPRAICSET
jgi:hypothetical protein